MVEELEDEVSSESRINKGQLQKAAFIRSHRTKQQTPEPEVCRGGGKLCIKLIKNVVINIKEEDGYEVCDVESEKKITRICHVCNKGFSSGKALGGHMRIHGHLYKKRQKDAAFDEQEEEEEEDDEYFYDIFRGDMVEKKKKKKKLVVPVCSICGKDFQSMKSLYGHMRSHPRNWKGIHPPPPPAENPVVDLKKALKCWSVTAKRGRKVSSAGDQTSGLWEDTEEEQLRDAAHDLMMLARGEYEEELDSRRRRRNSLSYEHEDRNNWVNLDFAMRTSAPPPPFSVGNTKNLRSNTGRVMTKNVPGKAKAMPENQEPSTFGGTANSSSGGEESKKLISRYRKPTYNNRANEKTRKKKMRLIKLKDLESVHHNAAAAVNQGNRNAAAAEEEKYKCGKCDKWFPSHQALWGHKSSHNKFKMLIQNSIDDDHQRQLPLIPSSQVTNSPGEINHTGDGQHHQILDFDLNQVPEEENEAAAVDDDHRHYGLKQQGFLSFCGSISSRKAWLDCPTG